MSEKMLAVFGVGPGERIILLEISGKWLQKEQDRQVTGDGGEDPWRISSYLGIGDRKSEVTTWWEQLGAPRMLVWEGKLHDIDMETCAMEFKGVWRLLTSEEWRKVQDNKALWPEEYTDG